MSAMPGDIFSAIVKEIFLTALVFTLLRLFRYDAAYLKGEDVWELRIKNVEEKDSGLFECQVIFE